MSNPICGVYAVATIVDPLQTIQEWKQRFRDYFGLAANWRGVTNVTQLESMLVSQGVKVRRQSVERRISLKNWMNLHARPNTRYIVRTGYHFQVVVNDIVVDQTQARRISDYWGKSKRVTHVIEIVE